MSEVSVSQIQLLPLLAVTVGDQEPVFLDESTADELYDQLTAVLRGVERPLNSDAPDGGYAEGFEDGIANATFQRPTVWFDYGNLGNPRTRRNVIPVTIKEGLDDVLLVGIELSKDGVTHPEPLVKSYRTGTINSIEEGHPTTWKVAEA
jgi:hypothetical protein